MQRCNHTQHAYNGRRDGQPHPARQPARQARRSRRRPDARGRPGLRALR